MSAVGHPDVCVVCQCNPDGDVVELGCKHVFHKECIAPRFPSNARNCPVIEIRGDNSSNTVENRSVSCPLCHKKIQEDQIKHFSGYVFRKSRKTAQEWESIPQSKRSKITKKNKKRMERRLKKEKMIAESRGASGSGASGSGAGSSM